jgi:hypothetical protein
MNIEYGLVSLLYSRLYRLTDDSAVARHHYDEEVTLA